MSVMSNLSLDIATMLQLGEKPATISAMLDIPISWIYEVAEEVEFNYESYDPHDTINS